MRERNGERVREGWGGERYRAMRCRERAVIEKKNYSGGGSI